MASAATAAPVYDDVPVRNFALAAESVLTPFGRAHPRVKW